MSEHETFDESMLSAYLDGEVTPEERSSVEAALESSPELRRALTEVQEVRGLVRAMPATNATPEFWEEALREPDPVPHAGEADTADDLATRRRDRAARGPRIRHRALVALGGVAVALVAVVALAPRHATTKPPVAGLANVHAARSSETSDPISTLAGVAAGGGEAALTSPRRWCGTWGLAFVVAIAPLLAAPATAAPGVNVGGSDAEQLLNRAREAAANDRYRGRITVQWEDGGTQKSRSIEVFENDGVLHLGGDVVLSARDRRLLRVGDGWQVLWSGRVGSTPDPGRKYRFDTMQGPDVAGRPTTELTVQRLSDGVTEERVFFDREFGLLLRRDQLDDHGRIVRHVAFDEVSTPTATRAPAKPTLPEPDASLGDSPKPLESNTQHLATPSTAGDGFRLSGRYLDADGDVQLYYSDGVLNGSVFEHKADLNWKQLPDGGRSVTMAGHDARIYTTAAATELVWENRGVTYVLVTDAPTGEIHKIVKSFPVHREPSTMQQIGQFLTGPFGWD